MAYEFLADTFSTERLKVLSTWSVFADKDLHTRPVPGDVRGRNLLEHMIHQCLGENAWFTNMLGIDVSAPPLPEEESRVAFINQYASDSGRREAALRDRVDGSWWDEEVTFFGVQRSRAWVLVRRVAHTAHHRGQQTVLLRLLGKPLHSTYGPTADTGGLPANQPAVIYPYRDAEDLLAMGPPTPLPGPGNQPPTERPD